jgi:PAS domain S-box-containing protein
VISDWTDGRLESFAGQSRPLLRFGPGLVEGLRQGRMLRIDDVATDPRTSAFVEGFQALGVRSLMTAPLIKQGRLTALLFVNHTEPRRWTDAEAKLAEDVAERTWAAVEQARAESSLRESEARFRAMADSAPAPVWVTSFEGGMEFANRAFGELAGVPQEDIRADVWMRLCHPDDLPAANAERTAAWAEKRPYVTEARYRTADGGWRWFQAFSNPRIDGAGNLLGYVGLAVDVTESRRVEAALRESEARFRAITNSIDQMIWSTRPDGYHDYFNQRWYDYTGVPDGTTDGEGWNGMFHPEDQDRAWTRWRHSLATGEPYEIEYRLRHRSGDYRWVLGRAQPVRAASGEIVRWYGTCTDIHDQKTAQDALRESEARFRAMADSAPAPVWVTGPHGGMEFANDALLEFTGLARDELTGDAWLRLVHPDDLPVVAGRRVDAWKTLSPYDFEARFRRADGEWRWLRASNNPRHDGAGAFQGYVGIGMDMTEVREAAAALEAEVEARTQELQAAEETLRQAQKMEAIGQLTGGIAHDINNLLTGILGSLHLMKRRIEEGRTGDLGRFMDAASASANRAAALTHRLLAFARRQSLDPQPLDVNALIGSMEELLHRTLGEQVQLETAFEPDLWPALADANQLESAVLNLSINARDAMADGGRLTIATSNIVIDAVGPASEPGLAPGDYVAISVADTGVGMSPEVMARAFDPFFTTKPIGQGTGLGLSMIYGFARQSNGLVRITSAAGQGTTVKLLLPRHTGALEEAKPPAEDATPRGSGEMVLVVEDDASVRLLVVETLRDLGYGALQASDGPSALPIIQSPARIDLLITDVGLPGMNGRQLAEIARQHRPGLKVLFVTGYAETAAVRGGFLEPDMDLVSKPFAMEALAAKISEMVSGAG